MRSPVRITTSVKALGGLEKLTIRMRYLKHVDRDCTRDDSPMRLPLPCHNGSHRLCIAVRAELPPGRSEEEAPALVPNLVLQVRPPCGCEQRVNRAEASLRTVEGVRLLPHALGRAHSREGEESDDEMRAPHHRWAAMLALHATPSRQQRQ